MRIRTTPDRLGLRDVELFPVLEQARQRCGFPDIFAITMNDGCVLFNVDGFFVERELAERLTELYAQYLGWWLHDLTLRKPRGWVPYSTFYGCAGIVVHRDHAQWWIDLFNEAAVFTYNPYQGGYASTRARVPGDRV